VIEDLRSRFLPRFMESSRGRLERARVLFAGGDASKLAHELHALAGEATMLDLFSIAEGARRGESAAIAWSRGAEGSSEAPRAVCADCLETVAQALHALSSPSSSIAVASQESAR
jgi:HPt (histidine-containing phosphotransfer) domain-containing protein